uniref:Uncharacterized protein n=1 Tax=Solanum tuberosum TaxID=4113 RepID=M1D805_SOLTU
MLAAGESVPAIERSDEEEDGNTNKEGRIPEEEAGEKELDGLNGNQDSEVTEEKKTEGLDPNRGWKRKRQDDENGNEGSGNNQNSEGNGSGNQESGGGKQPMSSKCEPMESEFLKMEHGESSNPPEDELPTDIEDHRDLAILRSMWNFKSMNGNLPDTPSDKLLKHILFSNPNFILPKEYLKMKIIEFHSNFEDVIQMDGPNPKMTRTIAREVFHLFNDPTPPTIALKIIPPIIVVVEETLKEEVVVSHPLEIIRIVNLGSRLLTAKLAAKYVMAPIT